MPFLHVHATGDVVVPYDGNSWSGSVEELLGYWVEHNQTTTTPTITKVEDSTGGDFSPTEIHRYPDGQDGAVVEHIKVIGGDHEWPGQGDTVTPSDLDLNRYIWDFFDQYDINGRRNS